MVGALRRLVGALHGRSGRGEPDATLICALDQWELRRTPGGNFVAVKVAGPHRGQAVVVGGPGCVNAEARRRFRRVVLASGSGRGAGDGRR